MFAFLAVFDHVVKFFDLDAFSTFDMENQCYLVGFAVFLEVLLKTLH